MAQFVGPNGAPSGYHGVPTIFQFTNHDGELTRWNCGQAAAATYLTFCGVFTPSEEQAGAVMGQLESQNPPDIVGGWFGTSRRQVEHICSAHGHALEPIDGEEALREHLDNGRPVLVMLAVPGPTVLGYRLPAGHWMVAFGYDAEFVYLTNWGRMTWDEFRSGWNSMVPRVIEMRNRGLVGVENAEN